MCILPYKVKNCLKKFIAWDGLITVSIFLVSDELGKAALIALIIASAAALDEYFTSTDPE